MCGQARIGWGWEPPFVFVSDQGSRLQAQQVGWVIVRRMLAAGVARHMAREVAEAVWPTAAEGTRVAYGPVAREFAKKS